MAEDVMDITAAETDRRDIVKAEPYWLDQIELAPDERDAEGP